MRVITSLHKQYVLCTVGVGRCTQNQAAELYKADSNSRFEQEMLVAAAAGGCSFCSWWWWWWWWCVGSPDRRSRMFIEFVFVVYHLPNCFIRVFCIGSDWTGYALSVVILCVVCCVGLCCVCVCVCVACVLRCVFVCVSL